MIFVVLEAMQSVPSAKHEEETSISTEPVKSRRKRKRWSLKAAEERKAKRDTVSVAILLRLDWIESIL